MEVTGKILNILRGQGNHPTALVEMEGITVQQVLKLQQLDRITVSFKPYRKKRSLNANSYYWKLCSELASAMHVSRAEMHNILLDRYGVFATDESENRIVHFMPENTNHLKMVNMHYSPAGVRIAYEGTVYCKYYVLKGSSSFNTKEMSDLIEGTVSECKEMDIETLPPAEIERMIKSYAKKNDKGSAVFSPDES